MHVGCPVHDRRVPAAKVASIESPASGVLARLAQTWSGERERTSEFDTGAAFGSGVLAVRTTGTHGAKKALPYNGRGACINTGNMFLLLY